MSMRKKMMDQKTDPVIVAMASGYTMKTRPGPGGRINGVSNVAIQCNNSERPLSLTIDTHFIYTLVLNMSHVA